MKKTRPSIEDYCEKEKEIVQLRQSESVKLRDAFNIINTQSVDVTRLETKCRQLESSSC